MTIRPDMPDATARDTAHRLEALTRLDETERRTVARLLDEVLPELNRWVTGYPGPFRSETLRNRLVWTCLSSAIGGSEAPPEVCFEQTALVVTTFAFDDILDGATADCTYEELEELCARCRHAFGPTGLPAGSVPSGTGAHVETVIEMLRDCAQRQARHPAAAWARQRVAHGWERFVDSCLREARWRLGLDDWPTFDAYMANAVDSIGTGSCYAAYAVACNAPVVGSNITALFDLVVDRAAEAVRLSNDLGSAEREAREGTPNAVALLLREGLDPAGTVAALGRRITKALHETDEAARRLPEELALATRYVCRTAHFAYHWYSAEDSYSTTAERLRRLLSVPADTAPRPEVEP